MAKMPENDNLVMESIEDLFNQADSVSTAKRNVSPNLQREQAKNIPIIGARPVRVERDAPATENILVLAGQKRPLSDQAEPIFSVEPEIEDTLTPAVAEAPAENSESENPFLAIRQAVISAGDADSDAGLSGNDIKTDNAPSPQKGRLNSGIDEKISGQERSAKTFSDRNFTDQIAQLIDNEIEVRLKAQLSIIALADHPAKAATRGQEIRTKTPPAKKAAAKSVTRGKKAKETKKQTTKAQKKSQKGTAAPTAKGTKRAPLEKPATSKSVVSKNTSARKNTRTSKKIASAKKKS